MWFKVRHHWPKNMIGVKPPDLLISDVQPQLGSDTGLHFIMCKVDTHEYSLDTILILIYTHTSPTHDHHIHTYTMAPYRSTNQLQTETFCGNLDF